MKKLVLLMMPLLALYFLPTITGCGASKSYVDQAIADESARAQAAEANLDKGVQDNKSALERLQSLASQLEKKTDMAINQAKGFESYQVIWEGEIYFEFNSSKLTAAANEILDQAGDKMTVNRTAVMEVGGYTDPTGPAAYNLELGNRRAAAAKYYLVDNYGVNLYRLFMVSYGENKAIESTDTQVSYSKQRKVVLKIWDKPQ